MTPADRGGRHAGVRPPRRHVRPEADADDLRGRDDRRVPDGRRRQLAAAVHRRARPAGHEPADHPVGHQRAALGASHRAGRAGHGVDQLVARGRGRTGAAGVGGDRQKADWHMLFWSAGVLGVMALLLFGFLVPTSRPVRPTSSTRSALLLAVGLVTLLLPISKGFDLGLDEHDDAVAVRRLRRGVRGVRGVAVPDASADRRSAHHAPPTGPDHQRRRDPGVLCDVRVRAGRAAGARTADRDRIRPRAVDGAGGSVAGPGWAGDDARLPAGAWSRHAAAQSSRWCADQRSSRSPIWARCGCSAALRR